MYFTGSTHSFVFMELWSSTRKCIYFCHYKQNICLWSKAEIDRATVKMEMLHSNLIWKQPNLQCDIHLSCAPACRAQCEGSVCSLGSQETHRVDLKSTFFYLQSHYKFSQLCLLLLTAGILWRAWSWMNNNQ